MYNCTIVQFALFSVSSLKDEKLILKKQTYIRKLKRAIFLLNVIKIDPYNFELNHFQSWRVF